MGLFDGINVRAALMKGGIAVNGIKDTLIKSAWTPEEKAEIERMYGDEVTL